jgi:hypothetical protein
MFKYQLECNALIVFIIYKDIPIILGTRNSPQVQYLKRA